MYTKTNFKDLLIGFLLGLTLLVCINAVTVNRMASNYSISSYNQYGAFIIDNTGKIYQLSHSVNMGFQVGEVIKLPMGTKK